MAVNGIEIKVGQRWRMRNVEGGISLVTIVEKFEFYNNFPFRGDNGSTYCADGREYVDVLSDRDLVELIDEPAVRPIDGMPDFQPGAIAVQATDDSLTRLKHLTAAQPQPVDLGIKLDLPVPEVVNGDRRRGVTLNADGYELLADVLRRAFEQASVGKGKERHASGKPFHEQPMQDLCRLHGVGFATGQASKKSSEALRLPALDRQVAELLGAIVYTAGAVIALEMAEAKKGGA